MLILRHVRRLAPGLRRLLCPPHVQFRSFRLAPALSPLARPAMNFRFHPDLASPAKPSMSILAPPSIASPNALVFEPPACAVCPIFQHDQPTNLRLAPVIMSTGLSGAFGLRLASSAAFPVNPATKFRFPATTSGYKPYRGAPSPEVTGLMCLVPERAFSRAPVDIHLVYLCRFGVRAPG